MTVGQLVTELLKYDLKIPLVELFEEDEVEPVRITLAKCEFILGPAVLVTMEGETNGR